MSVRQASPHCAAASCDLIFGPAGLLLWYSYRPVRHGCRNVVQPRNLKQNASKAGYHRVADCRPSRRRASDTSGSVYLFIAGVDIESRTAGGRCLPFAGPTHAFGVDVCVSPHRAPAQTTGSINGHHFLTTFAGVVFDRVYRVGAPQANATAAGNTT